MKRGRNAAEEGQMMMARSKRRVSVTCHLHAGLQTAVTMRWTATEAATATATLPDCDWHSMFPLLAAAAETAVAVETATTCQTTCQTSC